MHAGPESIAVIIPAYNGADYIAETIESVLRQTLPPSEIIVIDDGSQDDTVRIARSYEPGVKVISRPNSGVSATRNVGASLVTADWLAFLDQDDCWEPENLARQMAEIARVPDADFCYTDRRILSYCAETGAFILSNPQSMPPPHRLPSVLMDRCPFTPCSTLIRREAFLAVGGFDDRHAGVEDWDLWLRLSFHGARFVHCAEPLVHYRTHSTNASRNALRMLSVARGVIRQNIRPRMSVLGRVTTLPRLKSRLEGEAAILMRENRTPGSSAMMLRSILHYPFHEARRYRIALHMLLHKIRSAPTLVRDPQRLRASFAVLFE
jgi:GT2 family glycosyltransferase